MTMSRSEEATDQESVARHLIEVIRRRFAGEDEKLARIVGREPSEIVVLGVLDPREPLFETPSHPDLPDEPGVPIDVLPPSELGLTVWVDAPEGATHLSFSVEGGFSMYLPEYPTWEEQRRAVAPGVDAEADTDLAADDADLAQGDDVLVADSAAEEGQVTVPGSSGGEPAVGGGTPGPAGSRRSNRLTPAFGRRVVSFTTDLEIPLTGRIVNDAGAANEAIAAAVVADTGRLAYVLQGRAKNGVSIAALEAGEAAYEAELAERRTSQAPPLPTVEFLATAARDPRGGWRVNLTLANTSTSATRRDKPGQTVYNAHFSARLEDGAYRNLGFRLADADWRTAPEVYAHGRFCVGEMDGQVVRTNTWPIYRDLVFESRAELQPTFEDLVDDPLGVLGTIADRMDVFAGEWGEFAATGELTGQQLESCLGDREVFEDEAARFRRGVALLERDPRLLAAFVGANRAFLLLNTPNALHPDSGVERGAPRIRSWRLFQIVFIVLGLSSLAARELDDPVLDAELDTADVLWFPTGGGKSEAFLGLVAVALFYDRLRGKTLGTSALIRFPLRMLSVQQLDRVLRLITACEQVRQDRHPGLGDAFELGYFVGKANTPNSLVQAQDDRWGDITRMAAWSTEERRANVVITTCPYCGSTEVELVADPARVRLDHLCIGCGSRIPVVISDDEVYRTLPAVVVCTVDKLATIAFQPHFSHFSHGPAYRCPEHGYVTFAYGPRAARRCIARTFCSEPPASWTSVTPYDPSPALVIQDELHLLAEELGTLDAHYETLFMHLCRAGSGRAPKVIAATATISDYENQVRQLYALRPRRFPSAGYREGESFYASRLDLPRRLFVGALPSSWDTAQFGIAAAIRWREELDRLRSLPVEECVAELELAAHVNAEQVNELLFRYELQLFYANRKRDAERAADSLRRVGDRGPSHFEAELLTGDTSLADISAAIRRVEAETLASNPDPGTRLAAVAGTSLVSHGVDLARLNMLHVSGMPATNAYYVQATARAGRSDVGVVMTAFSRLFTRDRSAFHFFEPQHAYSAQLVEAVSLNRFAVNSPKKTATGMLSAVIINRIARDTTVNPPTGNDVPNLTFAVDFQNWLARQPAATDRALIDEVLVAYGLHAHILDPVVANYFADAVRHRLEDELAQLRGGNARSIQSCFLNKPPSSFRDIDEAVEFGAYGSVSRSDFLTLTNRRDRDVVDDSEARIAVEVEAV
jgi:hypothetical protein